MRSVSTPASYSSEDLAGVRRVTDLLAEGLNLAGIAKVLDLQDRNQSLQDRTNVLRPR